MKRRGIQKLNFAPLSIEPKTKKQKEAFESNKNLVLHGVAGTGKTFIALYLALKELEWAGTRKVVIIRSAVPTRNIGFLPGNEKEKSSVYEKPYRNILNSLYSRDDAYEIFIKHNLLEFITTSHIRGMTLDNRIIIVEECQNMTFHELDSIITRIGNNSRLIFTGDYMQADLEKNGLKQFFSILVKMSSFDFIEFSINDIVRGDLVKEYLTIKHEGSIKQSNLFKRRSAA